MLEESEGTPLDGVPERYLSRRGSLTGVSVEMNGKTTR